MSITEKATAKIAEFEHALVDFLGTWNRAEEGSRRLLRKLAGSTAGAYILTANLGFQSVQQGILSFAADSMTEKDSAAIKHMLKYFARVSSYRNYYIHGIQWIGYSPKEDKPFGALNGYSAKGRLAEHNDSIAIESVTSATDMANQLNQMIIRLERRFDAQVPMEIRAGEDLSAFSEDYPLPPELIKPKSYPLDGFSSASP